MNIMAKWTKTTPYGDYKDPLQNNKFNKDLHFTNHNDSTLKVFSSIGNILHEAKWYFGKHIGSKKLSNVKALNKKTRAKRSLIKKFVEEENKQNKNVQENVSSNADNK